MYLHFIHVHIIIYMYMCLYICSPCIVPHAVHVLSPLMISQEVM